MCDYSLCGLPTRLAAEGEELVVHKFSTGSMGLASPADFPVIEVKAVPKTGFWNAIKEFFDIAPMVSSVPAICIPPGARLILHDIPAPLQQRCGFGEIEGVLFTQLDVEENHYRDAVRFANGIQLRIQDLREGMRVEVLSLAAVEAEIREPIVAHVETRA
jgi:hypothetical protein